ncbi:MAG: DUF3990 domain-containing protein [Prevotellaceae bacterium]|nr:DUF3990 domain-containing protein [Prevotellaceae bacterium]
MIVYHSSNRIIERPDVEHSRMYLDFGKGFYVTKLEEQAIKYTKKFLKKGEKAFVNKYDLDDDWKQKYQVKSFDSYNQEWIDFVTANRLGKSVEVYDAVEGGIADDTVFETMDLYISGLINIEEALRRLVYKKPNHQICFLKNEIINNALKYIGATEIKKQ